MNEYAALTIAYDADNERTEKLCNVEAEAALLGALLIDNHWIEPICDKLDPSDFFVAVHGRIWSAISLEHNAGRAVTSVTIKHYFNDDPGLEELGGHRYLARLTADGQGLIAARELAAQIVDLAHRRRVREGLLNAVLRLGDAGSSLAEISAEVDGVIAVQNESGIVESDATEAMEAALAALDRGIEGVTCQRIPAVDELLGPLEPKSVTIVAGRPGMGKTAFSSSYALGAAANGHGVLFISLEMSRDQLTHRMLSDESFDHPDARVGYTQIQERRLNRWEREQATLAAGRIARFPLHIIDAATLTVDRLDMIVRRYKRRFAARGKSLDLVIVDYLQLVQPSSRKASPYEATSEVSRRLKAVAKQNDVAVMALAQLSRSVEQRPDKRPQLSDLRDSGQIEQDADAVLFLYREEYYLRQGEPRDDLDKHMDWETKLERCRGVIDFLLPKRRNGSAGISHGRFYAPYQAVRS